MSIFALIDGNNFFVSCQRVFQPKLDGKPVVVLSNNDGCIIARSNEAKVLGLKMGEPYFKAKNIIDLHNVKVFSANLELYCDMSARMMKILRTYAPKVEEYSIDEAFLDFSDVKKTELIDIGKDIKASLQRRLGLPVCVGFGHTKTLSKVANRFAKTYEDLDGVYYYDHLLSQASLGMLEIEDIWGVGKAYAKELRSLGIKTPYDLTEAHPNFIKRSLSIVGARIHQELRGISCYPLVTEAEDKKSITVSRALKQATLSKEDIRESVATHMVRACEKLRSANLVTKELSIFITTTHYTKGKVYSKSLKSPLLEATNLTRPLLELAMKMVDKAFKSGYQYKKTGVIVSALTHHDTIEKDLFFEGYKEPPALSNAIDDLNSRYGNKTIIYGATGIKRTWQQVPSSQSPRYTTRIGEILEIKTP